jgi:hypothetical protein
MPIKKTRSWQTKLKINNTRRKNGKAKSMSFNGATGKRLVNPSLRRKKK